MILVLKSYVEYSTMKWIVIPKSVQAKILWLSHYPKTAGHSEVRKMYEALAKIYYWPSMYIDCHAIVRFCGECAVKG